MNIGWHTTLVLHIHSLRNPVTEDISLKLVKLIYSVTSFIYFLSTIAHHHSHYAYLNLNIIYTLNYSNLHYLSNKTCIIKKN
jgi:hypothetical protein